MPYNSDIPHSEGNAEEKASSNVGLYSCYKLCLTRPCSAFDFGQMRLGMLSFCNQACSIASSSFCVYAINFSAPDMSWKTFSPSWVIIYLSTCLLTLLIIINLSSLTL
eukprot:1160741-Pelagomonas_calceolata.AAC.6